MIELYRARLMIDDRGRARLDIGWLTQVFPLLFSEDVTAWDTFQDLRLFCQLHLAFIIRNDPTSLIKKSSCPIWTAVIHNIY